MLETLGVVQVPQEAVAFRNHLTRHLAGKTLLEWIVRRVTDSQRLDGVIVVLSATESDQQLAELVPADIPVFYGAETDNLSRVCAALERFPARGLVNVRVNAPFIDPVLIDRLVTTAEANPSSDYISYCAQGGRPAILSPVGVYAEWIRVKSLRKANLEAKQSRDRDEVTRYLYSHPERFNLRLIPAPAELDRDDVRLVLDSEEDWEHTQTIVEALGADEVVDWQRIARLLSHQPALRERMAELNRGMACSAN